jgi:hypothetical protein
LEAVSQRYDLALDMLVQYPTRKASEKVSCDNPTGKKRKRTQ